MPKGNSTLIPKVEINKDISPELLTILEERFENNMDRHNGMVWSKVRSKLEANIDKLASLAVMEHTGGEPDVINYDRETGTYIFFDCSEQSPSGRRSICYDGAGEKMRNKKGVFPGGNAVDAAVAMGIDLLTEKQYRDLQTLGKFDTKTSSWIRTPAEIRELGGAVFCDRRYDTVFLYHNGAESFYSSRGFRGMLRV